MAYSPKAQAMRRCMAIRNDGRPCSNYAVWSDERRLCGAHGGRVQYRRVPTKTAYIPCTCEAYPYPHRPASGHCEWPDAPRFRQVQEPGRHSSDYERDRRALAPFSRQPASLLVLRLMRRTWR
jgi:hypothetical protein